MEGGFQSEKNGGKKSRRLEKIENFMSFSSSEFFFEVFLFSN